MYSRVSLMHWVSVASILLWYLQVCSCVHVTPSEHTRTNIPLRKHKGETMGNGDHVAPTIEGTNSTNNLTVIAATGAYYDVGVIIGTKSKDRILNYLNTTAVAKLRTWLETYPNASAIFAGWNTIGQTQFNPYWQEMLGYAKGSGASLKDILLINYAYDIDAIIRTKPPIVTHCTDVLVFTPSHALFGHNEDGSITVRNNDVLVRATYVVNGVFVEGYTGFHYPGHLAGNAWTSNLASMAFSTNALYPKDYNVSGLPHCFVARRVIASSTYDEAISILEAVSVVTGWNTNIFQTRRRIRLGNIELAPFRQTDKLELDSVTSKYTFHMNMYLRLNVSQWSETSSIDRLQRAQALPVPKDFPTLLAILGDTDNSQFPLYRDGVSPDTDVVTLTTTLYSALGPGDHHGIQFWAGLNPKDNNATTRFPWG